MKGQFFLPHLPRTLHFSKSRSLEGPFPFPGLVLFVPRASIPRGDQFSGLRCGLRVPAPARREEGRGRSTGHGSGGRKRSFGQEEGASWGSPPFRAHPQGRVGEPSLWPGTFLSLSPPLLCLGLPSPGVSLLSGVGLQTG